MKKETISSFFLLLFASTFIQCSDPVSIPQDIPVDIPIETLLSAPETLNIENQTIVLSTSMWRDFMPMSPPEGRPLVALIYIATIDSTLITSSIIVEAIYIVNKDQIWKSFFSEEVPDTIELIPFRITKIIRNGPKWTPRIYVDVIVRIKVKGNYFLLRASKQYIERTD